SDRHDVDVGDGEEEVADPGRRGQDAVAGGQEGDLAGLDHDDVVRPELLLVEQQELAERGLRVRRQAVFEPLDRRAEAPLRPAAGGSTTEDTGEEVVPHCQVLVARYGLRYNGGALPGAQTERRGGAGPVRALLGGVTSPAALFPSQLVSFRGLTGRSRSPRRGRRRWWTRGCSSREPA